jgi:hypothetical protein
MKISVSSLVFFIIGIALHIQTVIAKPDDTFINRLQSTESASTLFIENRGQIGDQNGKPNPEVKYLILRPGLNIQLKKNSFSYDGYTIERFKKKERIQQPTHHEKEKNDNDCLVYHFHRVDIELVDANPNPQIIHEGASSDYLNYYTHITAQTKGEEGVTGVRGYKKVSYHDIYPNIDLEWFLDKDGKPEYQFIIKPGGDPSRIRLKYLGAQKTELISDALHIHLKNGIIKEHIPLSYVQESQEKIYVAFSKNSENEYGFNVPILTINETLVIDPVPTRMWGTYFGGGDIEAGATLAKDVAGNLFMVGETRSVSNIATAGAWDVTYAGSTDIYLTKIASSGIVLWGTYYGGVDFDSPNSSIAIDPFGDLFIAGVTTSGLDIATSGAWDVTINNVSDAFLTKFSGNGTRIWGTYFGGNANENCNGLAADLLGNVYMVGRTTSETDIASPGAWDATLGSTDVFIAKFSSSGNRIWSTYYGGSDFDVGYGIATHASGHIYFTGITYSSTSIANNWGWDTTYGGGAKADAFVVKMNSSGIPVWSSYFGGDLDDIGYHIWANSSGDALIVGQTSSPTNIASPGAWDVTYNGGVDAFIAKFSPSGTLDWSTYFGGSGNDYGNTIGSDSYNIFISGATTSSSNIASSGVWDMSYNGGTDAFLAKFKNDGTQVWSTYMGGSGDESGISIAVHGYTFNNNTIYVSGTTTSSLDIATTGAWDESLGEQDSYIMKFEDGPINNISLPVIIGYPFCQNQEFSIQYTLTGTYAADNTFTVQLSDINGSFSNPTVVGMINSSISETIYCKIPSDIQSGNGYRIRIVSSNPSVIGNDNGVNLTISSLPTPIITGQKVTCMNVTQYDYAVSSIAGNTYEWTKPSKGTIIGNLTSNAIKVAWTSQGSDSLKVRQTNPVTGCSKDTFIVVTIQQVPKPTITGEAIICSKNTTSTFTVDSKSGYNITWSKPKNGRIIGSNSRDSVVVEWLSSGIDTVYVRYTDAQTGCFEETKKAVLIGNPLTPSIQGSASTCIDTVPTTYRTRFQAGQSYGWSKPRLGTIIGAINLDSVQIEWNASGQDTLILREFTIPTGCFKDTTLIITVNPRPQPSITGKSQVIENEQGIAYSVTSYPGSTYEWIILSGDAEITKKNGHIIELNVGDPGTVIVKVIQTTSDGCKNETQQEIVVKSITSVKEEIGKSFSVYPNPNNGQVELVVELPSTSLHEMRIELIDLLGITRYEGMIPSQISRHVIQLSDMPKGMYTIRLIMRDGVLSEKVIVE